MRSVAILFAALSLAACGTPPVRRGESQVVSLARDSVVQFLITAAATDFHTHRPPDPVRFRNVRIGHVVTPTGEASYRLCGDFLPAQKGGTSEWTPFVTLKTSGYEQYIGTQAADFCQGSAVIWDKVPDLPSSLQRGFDSLR